LTIKQYNPNDFDKITEYAESKGFNLPPEGILYIAEDKGEIKGLCNIRFVAMIEPFISDSPQVSKQLFDNMEFMLRQNNVKIVRAFTKDVNDGLLKKLGFYKIKEDENFYEKNYYGWS
jgi:hypothetical protein